MTLNYEHPQTLMALQGAACLAYTVLVTRTPAVLPPWETLSLETKMTWLSLAQQVHAYVHQHAVSLEAPTDAP